MVSYPPHPPAPPLSSTDTINAHYILKPGFCPKGFYPTAFKVCCMNEQGQARLSPPTHILSLAKTNWQNLESSAGIKNSIHVKMYTCKSISNIVLYTMIHL